MKHVFSSEKVAVHVKRLEEYVWYILLFSIPFQTRKFLYSTGVIEGFNEWQSIFLYGTDLIILMLATLWIKRIGIKTILHRARFKTIAQNKLSAPFFLVVFLVLVFISIFFASYKIIAVYRFLKLLEFVFVFFYAIHAFKAFSFSKSLLAFIGGAIIQSFIAIAQFVVQHSLGLKFFGEPFLQAGRTDVAEFVAFGARFMRAYGTFPSPNVLAAHLAVAIILLVTWYLIKKDIKPGYTVASGLTVVIISLALFLTFSRAVILAAGVSIIFFCIIILLMKQDKKLKKRFFTITAPIIVLAVCVGVLFWPEIYSRVLTTFDYNDLALRERTFFNELSYDVIKENPKGVGIGNYTMFLRNKYTGLKDALYQPVHNIFFLITAELGIFGTLFLSVFIIEIIRRLLLVSKKRITPVHLMVFTLILFVIISGSFDHYYWTLQQGGLILWLILGMAYFVGGSSFSGKNK
ncbi:MAG: O-antigen ligase family protein [Candidatus Spechtbacterales bacterium]|nr:O-antigen ligase family protein [Candidatus Spechtbacterales bacterium]